MTEVASQKSANQDFQYINLSEVYHLFQDLPLEIAMYDTGGRYKFVNKAYEADESIRKKIIGQDDSYYFKLKGIPVEYAVKRREHFELAMQSKIMVKFTEKLVLTDKNKEFYYKRNFQPIFTNGGGQNIAYIFLFGSDLSAVVLGQREVEYLAYHDKLTGLKNKTAFHEQLKQMEAEVNDKDNAPISAVLFCDLNNFKLVNDSLGHAAGDIILQEVASRLNLCVDKSDVVYRFGGDEFVVILRSIEQELDAGRIADKITKYLSKPFQIKNHRLNYLTSSIGVVLFPKDASDEATVLRNAETALMSAKRSGKNSYQFFSKTMTRYSVHRLKIEKNLTELVNKREFDRQFKILYQPIVEKKSDGGYGIIGGEALLRWHNSELGDVRPARFIPIAEETNLINDIGEWIFERTCKDYSLLHQRIKHPLYLSVNFSAKQLRTSAAIFKLERILYTTGFNPKYLQLELTETSYLDDHSEVAQNIKELENMGIKLALDDFGVGFASLSYLHKVPASTIKIDRSFIRHISTSDRHKELVKSIIMLGENLEKDVVAEGVEQVEDLYLLDSHRCYLYQGFLFSEPIELTGFEKLSTKETLLTTLIAP